MLTLAAYMRFCRLLLEYPNNSFRFIWNDYQPKLFDFTHPDLKKSMNKNIAPYFEGAQGICIGGVLGWLFQDYLKKAAKVVNVDQIADYPGNKISQDYVTDAANLYFAKDAEFDFVCSSHVLEHLTDPILAIKEWMRVIKNNGIIYCSVPDKRFTFDHKRKTTTLQHMKDDYSTGAHQDLTHLNDVLLNYDYNGLGVTREGVVEEVKNFRVSVKNGIPATFTPHQHVFEKENVVALFDSVGLKNVFSVVRGNTIHLVAMKSIERTFSNTVNI